MGHFFQNCLNIVPKLAQILVFYAKKVQICSKHSKMIGKMEVLIKIFLKFGHLEYEWVTFSLKKWYVDGWYFSICRGTFLPKPKLSTPGQNDHIKNK